MISSSSLHTTAEASGFSSVPKERSSLLDVSSLFSSLMTLTLTLSTWTQLKIMTRFTCCPHGKYPILLYT
jgi:hypothetical protein